MKRFLLFVMVCAIGMMVPENACSKTGNPTREFSITRTGDVVTIICDNADGLASYLKNSPDKQTGIDRITGASSIVFDGTFSSADLQTLKDLNLCTASTVNMAEAEFKESLSVSTDNYPAANYYDEPSGNMMRNGSAIPKTNGAVVKCNNKMYQCNGSEWVETTNPSFGSLETLKAFIPSYCDYFPANGIAMATTDGVECFYRYNGSDWEGPLTAGMDFSAMSFQNWGSNVTTAITSKYAPDDYYVGKANGTFSGCSNLVSVTYNSGVVDGVSNNASDIPNFTTVVIGANVTKIGSKAFQNITSITTLNASAAERLTVIEDHAFSGCSSFSGDGTGEFHVPNSVQTIEEAAFESCYGIVNLYFDAASQINSIKARAFWMTSEGDTQLKNIYVNVYPYREVPCDKGVFSKTDCCNQTALGTARVRLHYPPLYYDFYVGEYKSRYNGGGLTQTYLDQAYAAATNGWQEIMTSGIIMPDGVNWRTFSDEIPYRVPVSPASDGTVREIYLVHGYDAAKGAILVRMKVGDIIPKNTGVIVHYTFRSGEGGAALYLPPVLKDVRDEQGNLIGRIVDPTADAMPAYDEEDNPSDDKRYKPTDGTEYFKNYLKKLNKVTVFIDNVEIKDGQKTYRNYFFCNNDEMKTTYAAYHGDEWSKDCLNGWGFLRAVHGKYTISNKAYLHFPATDGFPGSDSVGIQENHETDTNTSSAKLFGFTTIDENGIEFECAPVLPGIATTIKDVETNVNDDSFYNMQGMKVDNPSKGIYIKNGKKYVIK